MNRLCVAFLALAILGFTGGQAPAPQPPSVPVVILPPDPVPPAPPPPVPGAVIVLETNQLYVVDASAPIILLASPKGIIKATQQPGPFTIRDVFYGGTGKKEIKTFKGPDVYLVEGVAEGTCELIIVPSMDPKSVIRRTIQVGAAPPPVPPPTPVPPVPPPTPVDPGIQAMIDAFRADKVAPAVAAKLAVVCHQMADTVSQDTAVTTYQQVFGSFSGLADPILDKTTTPAIHKLIGGEIMAGLGANAAASIDRALVKKVFTAIATQLEGVK